jgi:hypothetical protein
MSSFVRKCVESGIAVGIGWYGLETKDYALEARANLGLKVIPAERGKALGILLD